MLKYSGLCVKGAMHAGVRLQMCGLDAVRQLSSLVSNKTASPANAPVRIALEGNIAAGKSTYLEILRREYRLSTVTEPVAKWQAIESEGGKPTGGNLLDLFYKDPHRWAYTFQSYAFLSRMQSHIEAMKSTEADLIVMERSIHTDKQVFATNCWKSGLFNDVEWSIYCDWQRWITSSFDTDLDGIVYLRTSPETCLKRLRKRGRTEEDTVSLDYLKELHLRHEEWLITPESKQEASEAVKTPPILVLDCDDEFQQGDAKCEELLQKTKAFLDAVKSASAA